MTLSLAVAQANPGQWANPSPADVKVKPPDIIPCLHDYDPLQGNSQGCSRNYPQEGVGCRHFFVLWGEGVLLTMCPRGAE